MDTKRLEEIRSRINEYRLHEHDAYAYDPGEIAAVRDLKNNAPEDIEFLLSQLNAKP